MKQKILYILLGFSLGLNLSLLGAMAYWWTRPERSLMAPALERPLARLPAPLRQKIKEARRPLMPEFKEIRNELGEARKELYTALREQPSDSAAIEEKMNKITELQNRMQHMIVKGILEESNLLTPEERETYFKSLGTQLYPFRGPGPGPRGHGHGRGMGPRHTEP